MTSFVVGLSLLEQSSVVLVEFGIWNAVHIARRTTEVKVPCANNKSACKRCQQIFLARRFQICIIQTVAVASDEII